MTKKSTQTHRYSQRKFEKAIHDAICTDLPIAYGDAHSIDLELFEDENYKLTVKIFQDLFGHPSKQPSAQEVAKDVQIYYQNQGMAEDDAGVLADKIEDFKGKQPNTLLLRQALKALKTDTETPSFLHCVTEIGYPSAYDALLALCQDSQNMDVAHIRKECVETLNSTHTVVIDGAKVLVCEMTHDHTGKRLYKFYPIDQLRKLYANLNYHYQDGKRIRTENCFNVWHKDLHRNTHRGIVFDPSGKASDRYLNLWSGFLVEPIEGENKLDNIMQHLLHVICDGNEEHFDYFLAWLAHLIQKPEEKSGVCIVLKSVARGTGKSTVSKLLEALLGEHSLTVQGTSQLLGNFNAYLANKLLVTIEEAFWSGNPKDAGKLKTLITEPSIVLEGKGKDAVSMASFHRYILITNNDWAVPQTANERRFFVLEVSAEKAKNRTYFEELYKDINDPIAMGQFLNFLQKYDIDMFDLRNAPFTAARQAQIEESFEMHESWLKNTLEFGELVDGNQTYDLTIPQAVPKSSFYNSYVKYCTERGARRYQIVSNAKLSQYLMEAVGMKDGGRPTINGKRTTCYNVEPADIHMEKFQKFYSYK